MPSVDLSVGLTNAAVVALQNKAIRQYRHWSGRSTVNFKDFLQRLDAATRSGTNKASLFLLTKLKQQVSIPYPPASAPGASPHLRTGRGQAAISRRLATEANFVGSYIFLQRTGIHLNWLERGFANVAPRPWISVVYAVHGRRAQDILIQEINKAFR